MGILLCPRECVSTRSVTNHSTERFEPQQFPPRGVPDVGHGHLCWATGAGPVPDTNCSTVMGVCTLTCLPVPFPVPFICSW